MTQRRLFRRAGGLVLLTVFALVLFFQGRKAMDWRGCLDNLPPQPALVIQPKDPGRVRFVALGDQGMGNAAQAQVARAAQQVCAREGCDFLVLLGDNFYPAGVADVNDPQFQSAFESLYGSLGVPAAAIVGNHDVRKNAAAQVRYSSHSATWRMPAFQYAFSVGPARFMARNSNCALVELAGLSQALNTYSAESPTPWVFALRHHALYSTGEHGDESWPLRAYWERFLAGRVDFLLSGHNHILEHLQRPGDRSDYVVSGAGGDPSPVDARRKISAAESRHATFGPGLTWFDVTWTKVTMRFIGADGAVLYEYTRTH